MRIGIDFDNTIVDYTGVFYLAATKLGWIPETTGKSKNEVKQFFFDQNNERKWTELQGIVYGKEIAIAKPYIGMNQTIQYWLDKGHELFIISHKTRYPIIGDKLDFHQAAMDWLHQQKIIGKNGIALNNVYFNETKEKKLARIGELSCDVFIDDLPAILSHEQFPDNTLRVLFDVKNEHPINHIHSIKKVTSWDHLAEYY